MVQKVVTSHREMGNIVVQHKMYTDGQLDEL